MPFEIIKKYIQNLCMLQTLLAKQFFLKTKSLILNYQLILPTSPTLGKFPVNPSEDSLITCSIIIDAHSLCDII